MTSIAGNGWDFEIATQLPNCRWQTHQRVGGHSLGNDLKSSRFGHTPLSTERHPSVKMFWRRRCAGKSGRRWRSARPLPAQPCLPVLSFRRRPHAPTAVRGSSRTRIVQRSSPNCNSRSIHFPPESAPARDVLRALPFDPLANSFECHRQPSPRLLNSAAIPNPIPHPASSLPQSCNTPNARLQRQQMCLHETPTKAVSHHHTTSHDKPSKTLSLSGTVRLPTQVRNQGVNAPKSATSTYFRSELTASTATRAKAPTPGDRMTEHEYQS